MKVENLQREIQQITNQLKENLDADSFATWKSNPVTKLFFDDMQLIMLDTMIDIANRQPIDEQARMSQAKQRGCFECLSAILDWTFVEEEEES